MSPWIVQIPPTGWDYLRARYMDSGTGRFVTVDPFEGVDTLPVSLHDYIYVNANPINGTDPGGMFTLIEMAQVLTINLVLVGLALTGIGGVVGAAGLVIQPGVLEWNGDFGSIAGSYLPNLAVSPALAAGALYLDSDCQRGVRRVDNINAMLLGGGAFGPLAAGASLGTMTMATPAIWGTGYLSFAGGAILMAGTIATPLGGIVPNTSAAASTLISGQGVGYSVGWAWGLDASVGVVAGVSIMIWPGFTVNCDPAPEAP